MFKVIRTLVYGKFVNALSPLLVEGFQRILPGTFVMQVGRSEKFSRYVSQSQGHWESTYCI